MVALAVGRAVVTPMGTMIVKATIQVVMQELKTILQPIPTGTFILGLELKSKLA